MAGVILAFSMMLSQQVQMKQQMLDQIDLISIEECLPQTTSSEEYTLTDEEFDYLCRCVEAEAGDQPYKGKCYVVDCILNRVDSNDFPNDVISVINQRKQFEVVSNGRIWKVEVTEETRQAVREELKNRKDYEMLYFCMYPWFDNWAEYMFPYPKDRPDNCHHFYKKKEKKQ